MLDGREKELGTHRYIMHVPIVAVTDAGRITVAEVGVYRVPS